MSVQSLHALTIANTVRTHNARLCERLANMHPDTAATEVARILRDPSGPVGSIPIRRLLKAMPRVGDRRVTQTMRAAGVMWDRPLRELSPRQRREIARVVTEGRMLYPRAAA